MGGIAAGHERPHDPLVGRADELEALELVLDEVGRGPHRAIELVGEPGIGKTRLLSELATRAALREHLVLAGSASELERELPFSVFVHALDEYVESLDASLLATLDDEVQAELAHVLPSLSALAAGRTVALQHERYRSHRAVRALLEQFAQTRPLVLVLDDFHWADAASAELLGALLRRPPAAAVLIVVALRPRQTPERFAAALERAHRAAALARVELGALTLAEARVLLGERVDAADAAVLYEESGGNPFYLQQLARSTERTARAMSAPNVSLAGLGVPPAVVASLSEELTLLSESARLVLEGAAAAGDPFELELAAAAAAASEEEATNAIDELLELDLVRVTDVPRRFRFRHPLVRRAVYEATAGGWRLGAHERCAEALAARGASAAARAHHVERSARQGDLVAVAALREAGEEVARLAPDSAASWLGAALRLLPQSAPTHERIELLLARAGASAAGHFTDAHDVLLEARGVPKQSSALGTTLATACARVERQLGRYEQAYARLLRALRGLAEPASVESVELLIELTLNEFYRSNYEAMHHWAERAASDAKLLGDPALTAAALAMPALAAAMTGPTETAQSHRAEAAALVDELSDDELLLRPDAAAWLAAAELYLDLYVEADAHASRALPLARASGRGDPLFRLYPILPRIWYVRGKLGEAAELLDGAIEAGRLLGSPPALAGNFFNRSVVALAAGDLDIALATAEEGVELDARPRRRLRFGLGRGETRRRSARERATGREPSSCSSAALAARSWRSSLAAGECTASSCSRVAGWRWIAAARPSAQPPLPRPRRRPCSFPSHCLGRSCRRRGRSARRGHRARGRTRARVGRCRARRRSPDRGGAVTHARRPSTCPGRRPRAGRGGAPARSRAFDACGAFRYRESAERELGKLGRRPHRRTRAGDADGMGIDALSERELQVARLVVDRRTNPEIAAELFLSQKTVETHLRNIFRKMDVSSRVQIARAVERADEVTVR